MKNDDISVLNLTVRSYNALKRMGINTVAELETRTADVMKMLPKTYPRIFNAVEEYRGKPIVSSENEYARTYKEIFLEHFPDFDVSRFDEFAVNFCIAIFFDDIGQQCPYAGEDGYGKCKKHWENKCLFEWRKEIDESDLKDVEKYLIPKADETPVQEIIPAPAEETPAVFDYSELDSDRAKTIASSFNYALLTAEMGDFLKRKEQQLKNEYMNFTANCGQIFAEAQEKLAGNNQYDGIFEKWIASMGFAKTTVYRMIDVHKFCSSQIGTSKQEIFESLPKMLQYDISAKSAPPELVEQVMNGDITTHKDYIALKKQLEDAQKQAENAEMQSQTYQQNYLQMSKNFDEACEENTNLDERIKELEKQLKEASDKSDDKKIAALEAQIKELEKRDIQVVFEKDETEINRLQEENTQLEKQLREAQDELMFAAPPADDIKIFAVKLTLEEYEALTDIAEKYGSAIIGQAVKNAQIIRI